MKYLSVLLPLFLLLTASSCQSQKSLRHMGIEVGVLPTGQYNAITDVPGVTVGHQTLIHGDSIRTGVTAILPRQDNLYQFKVPAAMYIGNGYGKLMGYSQVKELGTIETPIVLTNTLSVATAANALIEYTLRQKGNEDVRSVNAIVGETNDGYLNDIRGQHVTKADVYRAIDNATTGPVAEGNVGAGTGTRSFGYKGGIGTASRLLPQSLGGYTVGVLVQANFGGVLQIDGVPVAKELEQYPYRNEILESADGSCMIVVITNAPVSPRNLERMAKRAMLGLAKTGGIASNGSGDYVIAVSNNRGNLRPNNSAEPTQTYEYLRNSNMTTLFLATIEATEEAILNALWAAESMTGHRGTTEALPKQRVIEILKKYGRMNE